MTRDYESLVQYIADRQTTPFEWGSRAVDCVSYWAGAIEAMTGENPLDWEPVLSWTTQEEAEAVLDGLGGLDAAVSARMTEIPVTMAQRGDGALVRGVRCVMIVEGETLVGPSETGNIRLPRDAAIKAWSATV